MALKFQNIPPDITEDENKINVENFFNTYYQSSGLNNFHHCSYDINKKVLHIFLVKN